MADEITSLRRQPVRRVKNLPQVNPPEKEKQNPPRQRKKNLSLKEKIENEAPCNAYMVNEVILATVPGFCPWPARIMSISGETLFVEFFGTGQV